MKKIELTHEGQKYEIDLEIAIKLGVANKVHIPITSFEVGDVFKCPKAGYRLLIVETAYSRKYSLLGRDGLRVYADECYQTPVGKEEIINHLNDSKLVFVKNIKEEVKQLIKS